MVEWQLGKWWSIWFPLFPHASESSGPIYVDMEVIKASRNTVPPDDVEESELSSTEEEWPDVIGEAGDLPM